MMTNGDRKGQIFQSHPYTINGFFFLLTTKYFILYKKNMKKISRKSLIRRDATWLHHFDITIMCGQRAAVLFYHSQIVWVCEIELSHMGKNNRNPDLVCQKEEVIIKIILYFGYS